MAKNVSTLQSPLHLQVLLSQVSVLGVEESLLEHPAAQGGDVADSSEVSQLLCATPESRGIEPDMLSPLALHTFQNSPLGPGRIKG